MSLLSLHLLGSPALRQRSVEVETVDDDVRRLVEDMFETMDAARGVGLAANQVGVAQRVFVVDVPHEDGTRDRFAVVNPVLGEKKGKQKDDEGCLSMPGITEPVDRSRVVRLRGFDEHGKPIDLMAEGFTYARGTAQALLISSQP